jgi:16S rRNA G966 N2-methylase RsmD
MHYDNYDLIIIKDDLSRPSFAKKLPKSVMSQFDIIFVDPPYGKEFSLPVLDYITKKNLLSDRGVIVVEERHNIILPDQLSCLTLIDRRTYGETGFSFYQHTHCPDNINNDMTIPSEISLPGVDQ